MWVLQRWHSGDGCVLASALCKYDLRKGDLFALSWARVRRVQGNISSELLMCCCCSPSETYGRKWGDSNFQILTELPVPPQAAGVVGTF